MGNPASGVNKFVSYKVEASYGVAPGASGAQLLRRTGSTLDLTKDVYESAEIRTDYQDADYRHGVRRTAGTISGELSPKTYSDFFASILKRDFTSLTAVTGVSVTIAGAGPFTVTRASGSYLTDGFKVGHVVRLSVGALNAANISRNLLIVDLTATVATVLPLNISNGVNMVAEGPITGTTITLIGKQTFIPVSGHTDKSFSIEHWFADTVPTMSEVFTGTKFSKASLALPPTGIATVAFDAMGKDIVPSATRYFTSPTAVTTTTSVAAVNGVLRVGGVTVASITGLTLDIAPGYTGDPVVGQNSIPFLFAGKVKVTGQITAYFDSPTLRDQFLNETEAEIIAAFTSDNTNTSEFVVLTMSRVKTGGASKDDKDGGIIQTLPFKALINNAGGTGTKYEQTTITMQDSAA